MTPEEKSDVHWKSISLSVFRGVPHVSGMQLMSQCGSGAPRCRCAKLPIGSLWFFAWLAQFPQIWSCLSVFQPSILRVH